MTNTPNDWISQSKQFARIPLELLSADLTLDELKVFILLASISPRDGDLADFTRCQKTYAEMLGWFKSGLADNQRVSDAVNLLKKKKVVTTYKRKRRRINVNTGISYILHLPETLKLRPTTDRSTPEYLAGAEAKRQAVLDKYKAKDKQKIEERTKNINFDGSLPDESIETIDQSEQYDEALKFIDAQYLTPDLDDEIEEVFEFPEFLDEPGNEVLKDMVLMNISLNHKKYYSHYSIQKQMTVFNDICTYERNKLEGRM